MLLTVEEVYALARGALAAREPFALVRCGDGEAIAMAQGELVDQKWVEQHAAWLARGAGIESGDAAAGEALAEAVRNADVVGVPLSGGYAFRPEYLPLLLQAFGAHDVNTASLNVCDCLVNYRWHEQRMLLTLGIYRRVILVGRRAPEALAHLQRAADPAMGRASFSLDMTAFAGAVPGPEGFAGVPGVASALVARAGDFDLALVGAGACALPICVAAKTLGKVAIDLGGILDKWARGEILL
jgi:hypothetical protein